MRFMLGSLPIYRPCVRVHVAAPTVVAHLFAFRLTVRRMRLTSVAINYRTQNKLLATLSYVERIDCVRSGATTADAILAHSQVGFMARKMICGGRTSLMSSDYFCMLHILFFAYSHTGNLKRSALTSRNGRQAISNSRLYYSSISCHVRNFPSRRARTCTSIISLSRRKNRTK